MSKVTSKLQVTVPKKIADQYGIRPGDGVEWFPAGDGIRVEVIRAKTSAGHQLTTEEKVALFDANTKWLDQLQAKELRDAKAKGARTTRETRGWTREELYEDERRLPRGFPRGH